MGRIDRESHTRAKIKEALQKRAIRGMSPEEVRESRQTSIQNKRRTLVTRKPKPTKPFKSFRNSTIDHNPKMSLLDVPPAPSVQTLEYQIPEWMRSSGKIDVSVIVPMYKSNKYIEELIRSWSFEDYKNLKVELILVDDCCPRNSKDAAVQSWQTHHKNMPLGKIIVNDQNSGFGTTCNIGAQNASGEYLIFLNADTEVTPNWIRPIVRLLRKQDVGIVGNCQLKKGGVNDGYIDSAGSEWCWLHKSFLHVGREIYNGQLLAKCIHPDNCPEELRSASEREMVTGCCFGIRKDLFREIGGFNINYRSAYWEDSEICMTVREQGYKIMYQPHSVIWHKVAHSNSGGHKFMDHNRNYFMNKWVNSGRIDSIVKSDRKQPIPEIRNILVQRKDAHGDALIASGVCSALKKKYPNSNVQFTTYHIKMFEGNPHIDKLIDIQSTSDRIFQLHINLDMAYEMRPKTNILKAYADVAGVPVSDCKFYLKTLPVHGLPEDYVVIHSGVTSWAGRNWSKENWTEFSKRLLSRGIKVVSVGSKSDHEIPSTIDLRGKTSIHELAHVIEKCSMFVGIDSFPMHVAQVFDRPGLSLFGCINPETRIFRDSMHSIIAEGLPCLGCHHRKLPPCLGTTVCETGTLECLTLVKPDNMTQKFDEIYERVKNGRNKQGESQKDFRRLV